MEIHLDITIDEPTLHSLDQLARITGATNKTQLIQDALRTLDWIVYNQQQNNRIIALPESLIPTLDLALDGKNFNVACLASYIEKNDEN